MRKILVMTLMLGVGVALLAPCSQASQSSRTVVVTFQEQVEIPGMVLEPGKYLIERTSPQIVTFWNAERTHVYASVQALAIYREAPAEGVIMSFAAGPQGAAVLKTIFYPGDQEGVRFIFRGKDRAGARVVYRTTVIEKVGEEPRYGPPSAWEPVVLRVDWNNRQEFDLNYAYVMFILGWDRIPPRRTSE
jgi:hypothetical protein